MFNPKDYYFNKAKKEKFLARSVYKIKEIDDKFKVIQPYNQILDLGYYPGSWIQYFLQKVKAPIRGIDIQEINAHLVAPNLKLYQLDIFQLKSYTQLDVQDKFDVISSDMAPHTMGIKMVDQSASLQLIEYIFSLLPHFLHRNGHLIFKVFESNDFNIFIKKQNSLFKKIAKFRPQSTRKESKELFVIALDYQG